MTTPPEILRHAILLKKPRRGLSYCPRVLLKAPVYFKDSIRGLDNVEPNLPNNFNQLFTISCIPFPSFE